MNNKKKYVRKEQYLQKKGQKLNQTLKTSKISMTNFNSDQDSDKELALKFDDKKILHLWLVEILPGKYSSFKLDLIKKTIKGNQIECQKKLWQCADFLDKNVLKLIKCEQDKLTGNFKMMIDLKFNLKIFDKTKIQMACQQIRVKYTYPAIMKTIQTLANTKYYYLISILSQQASSFMDWFEQNQENQFTKEQITAQKNLLGQNRVRRVQSVKNIQTYSKLSSQHQLKKIQSSKKLLDDEQKQSSVQEEISEESSQQGNNFYSYQQKTLIQPKKGGQHLEKKQLQKKTIKSNDAQAQKQQQKKKTYKQKNTRINYQNQQSNLIRKPDRLKKIFNRIYQQNVFDIDAFKKWVKNNKIVKLDEFQIQKKNNKVQISLITLNDEQSKLEALNIYFQYTKIILIDKLSIDSRDKIYKQFCNINQAHLKCKIIDGYMEPSTHQHKLRTLIMEGKTQKSNRNSKKFYAVWISGLSPRVQSLQENVRTFIQKLPKDDKIQNIILNLPKLEQYLSQDKQDRIRIFVQKVFNQKIQEFQHLSIVNVNFPHAKVALKLKIKYQQYDQFMQRGKQKLNKQFEKCISIEDLVNEDDMTKDLLAKYLLVQSVKDSKIYTLITKENKAFQQAKQILTIINKSNSQLKQFQISFKKGRLQQLKNYLQEIKNKVQLKDIMSKVKFSFQKQNKLQIIGTMKNTNQIYKRVSEYLSKLDDSIVQKTFFVTDAQASVIEKNMDKFSQQIQKSFRLSFNLSKDIDFGAVFSIADNKSSNLESPLVILVEKHKNIFRLPNQTTIFFQSITDFSFFTDKSFNEVKAYFHNRNKNDLTIKSDTEKDYFYLYSEKFPTIQQMVKQLIANYPYKNPLNKKTFAFVMPTTNKSNFVIQILQSFENYLKIQKQSIIKIFIFQQPIEDLKKSLLPVEIGYNKVETKYQYYVVDKQQFYYSKEGDEKINKAIQMGKNNVYLTNQDLNLKVITHQYYLNQNKIVHIQSGKSTQIKRIGAKYIYEVNHIQFQLPSSQAELLKNADPKNPIKISVGAYQLDLKKMIQTNLFSGFTRNLLKKQINKIKKNTGKLCVSFDEKVNQIQIAYEHKQQGNAIKACQKLKNLIEAEKIVIDHKLQKAIKKQVLQNLKSTAKQLDVDLEMKSQKELRLTSFDKGNITRFIKNVSFFINQESKKQIQFPKTWVDQKSDIQTFIVPANSTEFKQIQDKFRIANIKQLVRIQNSLVYRKYQDQKAFLTELNGGKIVKQMMLFHGTRSTDPKLIYEDKQECFNINYTSDSNYLGRGTYFAETPEYSHNYAYQNPNKNVFANFIVASHKCEMFMCSVLVGDSQVIANVTPQSMSMKDTSYKNPAQKIRYESSTTFTNNSNIYTVYKNRRAYPHYLIRY